MLQNMWLQKEKRRPSSDKLPRKAVNQTHTWTRAHKTVEAMVRTCEGCDIVQSDHALQAGVAQGIFNGDLIRRRDGHQVELVEELDEEVERRVRRNHSRHQTQVRMHG